MRNTYGVVARTYLQRWRQTLFVVAYLALLPAVSYFVGGVTPQSAALFIMNLWFGVLFFAGSLGRQLKEQFANPQAALMPNFRMPHLAVASAVSLAVLGPATVSVAWVLGKPLLG